MLRVKNINSIQVFEVVSRLGNATHAARLLNISQSSVSYHIKKLETEVCTLLFERKSNGLVLTPQGAILASHIEQGLRTIQAGLKKVTDKTDSVRVAVPPMFASRWLSARLGSLWEAHPSLQLSFQNHNNTYIKLERPEGFADLGIHWGRGAWKGFSVTRLWPGKMVVVCSPTYLKANPIRDVADIKNCTLLHVDDERMWLEWFNNNHVQLSSTQTKMMREDRHFYEDRHFLLSSTINSLGISLIEESLIASELKSGAVVNPLNQTFDSSSAYHIVIPKSAVLTPSANVFKEWLLQLCLAEG